MACIDQGVNIDRIDIEAIDRMDVPQGSYTIQYNIEDLSDLVKNYGATVSFRVTNSDLEEVLVSGNTFDVVANEIYTVVIRLSIRDVYKEKTITITAIKLSDQLLITYELNGGNGNFPALTVARNAILTFNESPTKDGFSFGGWYMDSELTTPYTNQEILNNTTLYAKWNEVVISTVLITFDLQGGNGYFVDQIINMGAYAIKPTEDPTKEGFIFLGWHVQATGEQLFDFETTMIYQNTTIYALWEEDTKTFFTVTYDLNGTPQSEIITEKVEEGSFPLGPSTQFSYVNHVFIGWSLDQTSETSINLETLTITEDLSLYAVWHINFHETSGITAIANQSFIQSSTLNQGLVEQKITLQALIDLESIETDLSITEDRMTYGMLYSLVEDMPKYYSENTLRIEISYDSIGLTASTLHANLLSDPLKSDSTYTFVLFARYETHIIYSQAYTYKTFIQVKEGTVIGANDILSGGYYKVETDDVNFMPFITIDILDGFEASLDGLSYASLSHIEQEGIHQLITKDILTGDEYLHVFSLGFQTPHVTLNFANLTDSDTSFIPQYHIIFPFDESIDYPISEIGVLYATEHPFLKLDVPGVSQAIGSLNQDHTYMITDSPISVSNEPVYIRGYIIVNGKVSYAKYITKLVMNTSQNVYEVVETIDTAEEKISPENGISLDYTPEVVRVYKVADGMLNYVDYISSFELMDEGQYFIRHPHDTGNVLDILIKSDFPLVIGAEELGQYIDAVSISYDTYNPEWYYVFNEEDPVYLPAHITLTVPGYYELYYRSNEGLEVIHFEIITELVE